MQYTFFRTRPLRLHVTPVCATSEMTIERQWIEVMKVEVPDAFSAACPFVPEAAFIDAQIKLMSMPHSEAPTWQNFLHKQFVVPVQNMYGLGATTVILAFDDYEFVPRAKAITQAKRRARVTPIDFTEGQQLPPTPPVPWDGAMANRAFKAKVVELVVTSLPSLLHRVRAENKLIIDWNGEVDNHWTWADNGALARTTWPRIKVRALTARFPRWSSEIRPCRRRAESCRRRAESCRRRA